MPAMERGGTGDDDSVGVAKSNVGAHGDQLISEEHAGFIHPVVEKNRTLGLGGKNDEGAHEVGGEAGPGAGLELLADANGFYFY